MQPRVSRTPDLRNLEELRHGSAEVDKVDRLGNIITEAGGDALLLNVGHDVGGEGNDGHLGQIRRLLPLTDFAAGLVAILAGHVKIALGRISQYSYSSLPSG